MWYSKDMDKNRETLLSHAPKLPEGYFYKISFFMGGAYRLRLMKKGRIFNSEIDYVIMFPPDYASTEEMISHCGKALYKKYLNHRQAQIKYLEAQSKIGF